MKPLKEFIRSVTLGDVFLLAGFASLMYGLSLIYVPAAWIAGGILLLGASWMIGGPGSARSDRPPAPSLSPIPAPKMRPDAS